jgi:hypothetical protein
MKYAKYFIMIVMLGTCLAVAAPTSHAQVAVGVGVGPGYVGGPPACAYGYYGY